jgi:hypothetical protein
VEGVRPDIRIVNTSLLGIDWYVNQLRYKVNESAPINLLWSEDQIRGLSYIVYKPDGTENQPQPIYDVLKNKIGPMLNADDKSDAHVSFSAKHLIVPVDTAFVRQHGVINPTDTVGKQIQIDIPDGKNYLSLDQLTMLNIIAANNWKRPICFTSPYQEIGFGPYLRQEGLVFRLVPVRSDASRSRAMDVKRTDSVLMTKFRSGGANIPGEYFDEENRRHLLSIRQTYAQAAGNMADQGNKQEAVNLLNKSESLILPEDMPYAMVSRGNFHNQISMFYLESAYKAGHTALANKLKTAIRKDLTDQKKYYNYLKNYKEDFYGSLAGDDQDCDQFLGILDQWEKMYNSPQAPVKEIPGQLRAPADSSPKK